MVILRRVGDQRDLAVDRAQEQPASMRPADEVAVLPLPAEARGLRQRLFHHRGGIDEDLERAGMLLHQPAGEGRSEEHTSELQSLMRISYAVFCLHKKKP